MKDLGANAIRVYHVDAIDKHKGCMDAFAAAGIYLFVDLDTFNTQIAQVCSPPVCFVNIGDNCMLMIVLCRMISTGTQLN
jgi:hypothetical protein